MPRKRREAKPKVMLFFESKTQRIMEQLGFDFAKFKRAYAADPGRRGPKSRPPTSEELHAVDAFLKTGDFAALKKALQTENIQTANAAVARVMSFKAKGRKAEQ